MTAHVVFPLVPGIVHPRLRGLAGWTIRETAGAPAEVTFRSGGPAGPVLAVVGLAANGFDDVLVGLGDYVSAPDGVYAAVTGSVEGALYAGRTERVNGFAAAMASTNPVAWWRLGETAGTVAGDASGNGHDGTYQNGPTLGQPGLIVDTDTAVVFDGSNDHVAVPQDPALQITGALTVQAWIRPATAKLQRIISQGGSPTPVPDLYDLWVDANGALTFAWYDGIGYQILASSAGAIVPGNTYHVAATRSAAFFARLYIDGVEVAAAQKAGPVPGTPTHFRIGSSADNAAFFNGTIDEPAVHDYALTPEQVAGLYAAGSGS